METNGALLTELESIIGYRFTHRDLLVEACTHRSYANESRYPTVRDNERLEFLGDAVLGLLVGELLYSRFSGADEGTLTRLRSGMVDEPALAGVARTLGLDRFLLLGRGAEREGVRTRPSILASLFESLVAAVYLDGGLDAVKRVFSAQMLRIAPAATGHASSRDSKSQLQELMQAECRSLPSYRLISTDGPPHDRTFTVEVISDGMVLGTGAGRSKKEAEQAAARMALESSSVAAGKAG